MRAPVLDEWMPRRRCVRAPVSPSDGYAPCCLWSEGTPLEEAGADPMAVSSLCPRSPRPAGVPEPWGPLAPAPPRGRLPGEYLPRRWLGQREGQWSLRRRRPAQQPRQRLLPAHVRPHRRRDRPDRPRGYIGWNRKMYGRQPIYRSRWMRIAPVAVGCRSCCACSGSTGDGTPLASWRWCWHRAARRVRRGAAHPGHRGQDAARRRSRGMGRGRAVVAGVRASTASTCCRPESDDRGVHVVYAFAFGVLMYLRSAGDRVPRRRDDPARADRPDDDAGGGGVDEIKSWPRRTASSTVPASSPSR